MMFEGPTVTRPRLVEGAPWVKPLRRCKWCGQKKTETRSGHLRAHRCEHGSWCVPPYNARRGGVKGHTCRTCFEGRQLSLFDEAR